MYNITKTESQVFKSASLNIFSLFCCFSSFLQDDAVQLYFGRSCGTTNSMIQLCFLQYRFMTLQVQSFDAMFILLLMWDKETASHLVKRPFWDKAWQEKKRSILVSSMRTEKDKKSYLNGSIVMLSEPFQSQRDKFDLNEHTAI